MEAVSFDLETKIFLEVREIDADGTAGLCGWAVGEGKVEIGRDALNTQHLRGVVEGEHLQEVGLK